MRNRTPTPRARSRRRALSLSLALLAIVLPARAGSADEAAADPNAKPGTGRCAGMYESTFAGRKVCTHGPDEYALTRPAASRAASFPGEPVRGSRIPCYKDGPYVRILYVYDSNNLLDNGPPNGRRALIREAVALADEMFYDGAKAQDGYRRVRWRMTSTCKLAITPMQSNSTYLFTIGQQALNRGKMKPSEHGVALVETGGCMGLGQTYDDQRPGQINLHNRGPMIATVNTGCINDGSSVLSSAQVLAHELLHTLGAVQDGAPNSTGAMHCHDEWDVMCYQDGGPTDTIDKVCTPKMEPEQLDCRKNDYYSVRPRNGSYLDNHWNTANSRYLARKGPAKWDLLKRPKPTLTGVPNGLNVSGSFPVTVAVDPPPDAGISRVDLFVDGQNAGQDGNAPFDFTVNTKNYKNDKTVKIQAVAYDKYNRPGASAVRSVTVGNPTIHLDTPIDMAVFTGGTFEWSATARAHGGRTVTNVELQVIGSNGTSIVDNDTTGTDNVFGGSFTPTGTLYQVRARVTDSSGTQVWTKYRGVGAGEPSVELISPNGDFPVVEGAILLAANAEQAVASDVAIDRVEFLADGVEVAQATAAPYAVSWTPPSDDQYEITARVVDEGGATAETWFGATMFRDGSPHSVDEGWSGSGATKTLTASPTLANGATVTDMSFYIDGSYVGSDADVAAPWTFTWDSRDVGHGPHILRVSMSTDDGDTLASVGEILTVSNDSIQLSFSEAPGEGTTFRGSQPIGVSVNGATGHTFDEIIIYANGMMLGSLYETGSIVWNTRDEYEGLADGPVTLTARATAYTDFGSYTTEVTRSANLKNTYAKITAPTSGQNITGRFVLTANAGTDKDATVDWVRFFIDGNAVGRDWTSPYALEWPSGSVADGGHTVTAQVGTDDGRTATSNPMTFTT